MEATPKTFRELFCEHWQCPPDAYERTMFRHCLYRHALPLSLLLKLASPNFFEKDFEVIRQLGITRSQSEFHGEVEAFFYNVHSYGSFLQRSWRIRISGKRLIRLSRLFAPSP